MLTTANVKFKLAMKKLLVKEHSFSQKFSLCQKYSQQGNIDKTAVAPKKHT